MRAEFCLRRPDLLSHEKCLKFLMDKCMEQTSGYGYCTEFHEILEKECNKGEVLPGENEACDYHNKLDTVVDPDDESDPTTVAPTTAAPTTAAPTTAAPTTAAPTEAPEASQIAAEENASLDDGSGDDGGDAGDADGADDAASSQPAAPAPSAVSSPGPAPPAPGPVPLPPAHHEVTNFDKKWRDLPEQGYDERSDPKWVKHQDFDTQTEDWRQEWPSWDETEGQSTDRICEERPDHLWCRLWLKDRARGGSPAKVPASAHSSSAQSKSTGRVSATEQVAQQTDESHENVQTGAAATGDQFGDAADETSAVLPPGMSPTEKDLKDGENSKKQGMSDSGHDLPPGMLTHPDDYDGKSPYESKLAFKAEEAKSTPPTISIGDDHDFASDDDFTSDDVNYDDPEAVDASLNNELKENDE